MAVSTLNNTDKIVSIDPEFKFGDEKKRIRWIHKFMIHKHLAL